MHKRGICCPSVRMFVTIRYCISQESCAIAKMTARCGRHLEFIRIENSAITSAVAENPTLEQNMKWIDDRLQRYGHLKFFQDGGGRHLGFVRTGNSAVRSAVPENHTLEPNMKWIGSPVAEIWLFAYVGGIWNPHLFWGEGEVLRGQQWHH